MFCLFDCFVSLGGGFGLCHALVPQWSFICSQGRQLSIVESSRARLRYHSARVSIAFFYQVRFQPRHFQAESLGRPDLVSCFPYPLYSKKKKKKKKKNIRQIGRPISPSLVFSLSFSGPSRSWWVLSTSPTSSARRPVQAVHVDFEPVDFGRTRTSPPPNLLRTGGFLQGIEMRYIDERC